MKLIAMAALAIVAGLGSYYYGYAEGFAQARIENEADAIMACHVKYL